MRVLPLSLDNTYGEAGAVRDYARATGTRSIVVVTSPYHTRRAWAVFRALSADGIRVGIVPAVKHSPASPHRWWASPYDRAYVFYEWSALASYAVRYRVWAG